MMEFVGRAVKKEFKGRGIHSGVVKSFDTATGFFEVEFEGGDSEELDLSEVSLLLEGQSQPVEKRPCRGRKPKKRRRIESKCEIGGPSANAGRSLVLDKRNPDETLEMGFEVSVVCVKDLNESFNLNDEVKKNQQIVDGVSGNLNGSLEGNKSLDMNVNLSDGVEDILERRGKSEKDFERNGSGNGNLCRNEDSRDGFDLNARSSSNEWLNLNDGSDLHASPSKSANLERRGSIDLNLYVNADFDENLTGGDVSCSQVEIKKREWDFDLNLEVNDVHGDTNNNGGEEIASSGMGEAIIDKVCDEAVMDQICDEAVIDQVCDEAAMDQVYDNVEGLRERIMESEYEDGNLQEVRVDIKEELPKDSYSSGGDVTVEASLRVSDLNCVNDGNLVNIDVKDVSSEAGPQTIDGCQGNSDSQCKQRSGRRKRRKVLDGVNTPDTVLRRSTRRGIVQKTVPIASSDISSPVASVVTEEKQAAHDGSDMPVGLSYKLQLPPSSKNLNLDDIPILDLFSIYACLRSFSTLLFLSPFELDDFVAALKCKSPTILFDNIHLSVLQTLRKHLEDLSTEGSESASSCLRSLNWDMLDLITWPIFMVEYLLIHGSGLKPGVDLCQLKLLKNDYYKLPTGIKIEILRCLCDDMIEVEAIRSEINRRSLAAEPEIIRDRSLKSEVYKKKKISANASINSCQSEDTMDDTADWNSDECCLCRMDGSLICCDGCPAAYHLKCVGIANDLLPEGDWFCPECAIDRHKSWMKTQKSLRGAEFLGVDPHGRTYFSSCGYLLVSDSCDTESSVSYYHRNDLDVVTEALRSSYSSYSDILVAIYKHWDITFTLNGKINKSDSQHCTNGYYSNFCHKGAKSANLFEAETILEGPAVNESAIDSKLNSSVRDIQKHQTTVTNGYEFTNQANVSGKFSSGEDPSLLHPCLDGMQESNTRCAGLEHPLSTSIDDGYSNFYSFAQTASLVADEFMRKSSEKDKIKEKSTLSEEEIIAAQMKVILRKTSNFCWPFIQNISAATQKEKCGWCFPCKASSDEWDCLFKTNNAGIEEGLAVDVPGLQLKRKGKGHLKDVICQILSIENRLQGLLLGPWLNSHHSRLWREGLLAFDFNSVKHLLLMIESNLRHPAISAEWFKYVDSVNTLGSASLFITSSLRATRHGISRKRARFSDIESNASSNGSSGLSMFWWRGGQLSRRIFNWKVLPRSLVSKAARQAGCTKIPGIAYPEGSECARRSRCIAWRAAVEASTSVEQLAFQVREFYSNVRWYDVENTHPLPTVEKELRKSIRLFKKVIVRRKSVEGDLVKYLLDFGKRRVIPDVVKKHGVMLEDSERKRYWLNETYVPLHLVKNFEEKRIARRANEAKHKIAELGIVKSSRKKGFAYLFSRADKLDLYQCGRCNKVVPVREAVSCRYCQGIFHKKHVKKYVESVAAKCTYTCHICWDGISVKPNGKRGKSGVKGGKLQMARGKKPSSDQRALRLKNRKKVLRAGKQAQIQNKSKVPTGIPLRRSARQAKFSSLQKKKQDKKVVGSVKRKKIKTRKGTPKKRKRETSLQKKRTLTCHSFWLNGLFLSRKPDDERVTHFREKKLLLLTPRISVNHEPKCNLCSETEHSSVLNYIACQNCGVWFHGDAFGLDQTKIDILIGFRCHICRKRMPPVCPHQMNQKADTLEVSEVQNSTVVYCSEEPMPSPL